jgi:Fur family ferric uptake transcriptional regulator
MDLNKKNNTFLIKNLLLQSSEALSHMDIQQQLAKKCNRVTIYRILDRLIEKGEVHKIVDTNGVSKFAPCASCEKQNHQHEHLHFSCTKCLAVTCLNEVSIRFEMPKNYLVLETHFTISGICPNCI